MYFFWGATGTFHSIMQQEPRIRVNFKRFTGANTGLDKPNQYPELGSTFKAAFVKSALWFFALVAMELSEKFPHEAGHNYYVRKHVCVCVSSIQSLEIPTECLFSSSLHTLRNQFCG